MRVLATVLALLAVPALGFAQSPTAESRPRYLEKPEFLKKPTGQDLARYYPDAMQRAEASGAGAIECRILASGALSACVVLQENPTKMGLGEAMIALSKTFSVDMKKAPDAAGSYVILPIVLRVPGGAMDAPDSRAGQPAYVVTYQRGANPDSMVACSTAADPKRQCYLHRLSWSRTPDFGTEAAYIEKIGRKTGRLTMTCNVGSDGVLADCSPSEALTGAEASALGGLLAQFESPQKSIDGTALAGGTVVMMFDFGAITALIDVSALKRPR